MTKKTRITLFDTTLRDGAQTQGVDFSVEDKRVITEALDALGVDYVEGGWPGANPTDNRFFAEPPKLASAKLVAFGMTRRGGRSVANDPGLADLLDVNTGSVCMVGKCWDYHVDVALGITREENLAMIHDSVAHAVAKGREVIFDAEHFFDGYKSDAEFALSCLRAASKAGASWLVLCDTNGGTLPHEVTKIVTAVGAELATEKLGIHAHNDTENAVANSLAAVSAGVRMVQGTLNGLGERCGNANLSSIIPTLLLKPGYADKFETGITKKGLTGLTRVSRQLDELLNLVPDRHAPYVGVSAFAHKGGLHVSAVTKDPKTYEHIEPELVGNRRNILVSDQAGRSNILSRLAEIGLEFEADDTHVSRLLDEVKDREYSGYAYDGAPASFELLARRALGQVPEYFFVESFRTLVERRYNAKGRLITVSEATVKVIVDDKEYLSVGEGNGPVNALDAALRRDLGRYDEYIADLRLVDFKVRIINQGGEDGTDAVTRVLVESADGEGRRWYTVGVSANIVDASFEALSDAIIYKLYRDGAPPPKS